MAINNDDDDDDNIVVVSDTSVCMWIRVWYKKKISFEGLNNDGYHCDTKKKFIYTKLKKNIF